MTESADYDPGVWKGHDFGKARDAYDRDVRNRSFKQAKAAGKTASDFIAPSVSTQCTAPLVIVSDVTGSMADWPTTIFSKLPYLDIEGKEYLGEDMEICFAAVGDARKNDQYPLQVRPFGKGKQLERLLKELTHEGGGGGGGDETYELAALYFATQCDMPNAVTPIIIFIGDEHPYGEVLSTHAQKFVGINLEKGEISTTDVFAQLKEKFAVYLIRKPYYDVGEGKISLDDKNNLKIWGKLIGEDHIATLPSADRVVDVIFGILAQETSRVDYFREEIEGRQTPGQVETVYKSLETVHILDAKPNQKALPAGASRLMNDSDGDATKSLI